MRRFIAIAFLLATSQAWAAFGYYSPVSINAAQVPSTQTDFPVLVSVTDNRFKTVGNGGHVQNSSGFDIRPYTDSTLSTAITGYELERYNASTGEVIMWVKVSSLSSSTTPFVLAYGDSGISTDGSSNTTWSNSFVNVYHLKDGTTLSLTDSTSNAVTLTNNNGVTAVAGQIDGAGGFASASSQSLSNASEINPGIAFTLSAWVKGTSFPNAYNTAILLQSSGVSYKVIYVKSNGKLAMYMTATADIHYDGGGLQTLSTGTWYYLTMSYDSSSGLIGKVNASADGTGAANGNATSTQQISIGNDTINAGRLWNGPLDEVRVASVARSADWISTEYNNQNAPGTFETLGTEVAITATNNGWFYFFP